MRPFYLDWVWLFNNEKGMIRVRPGFTKDTDERLGDKATFQRVNRQWI